MDPYFNSRLPTLVAQGNQINMESLGDTIANQARNHSLRPKRRNGRFYKTLLCSYYCLLIVVYLFTDFSIGGGVFAIPPCTAYHT
jgi:hypothetical protein